MNDLSVSPSRMFLGVIPWYGFLIMLGAVLAIHLAQRESVRFGFPKDCMLDLALWVIPIGILGARIYYVLFSLPFYLDRPLSVFFIWEGGLAIYGGLIAGALTVCIFCRVRSLSLPMMLDFLVPGVALAQAIGRWGNYFNQEAYGPALPDHSPLAFFPLAVQIPGSSGLQWHVATFFLESCWNFCVFLFLFYSRRKWIHQKGDVFLFYLLLYGAARLFIEELRTDSLYAGGRIRVSQLLSVLLCLSVQVLFLLRFRRFHARPVPVILLLFADFMYAAAVLLFCFGAGFQAVLLSLHARLIFLAGFSLLLIISSLFLYASDPSSEVPYAYNTAS